MAIQISNTGDQTLVQLSGALTIAEAMETRDQLALTLAISDQIAVDLAEVIEIDTAGVQLLLALGRGDVPVSYTAISDPLRALLDSLNLLPIFGLEH